MRAAIPQLTERHAQACWFGRALALVAFSLLLCACAEDATAPAEDDVPVTEADAGDATAGDDHGGAADVTAADTVDAAGVPDVGAPSDGVVADAGDGGGADDTTPGQDAHLTDAGDAGADDAHDTAVAEDAAEADVPELADTSDADDAEADVPELADTSDADAAEADAPELADTSGAEDVAAADALDAGTSTGDTTDDDVSHLCEPACEDDGNPCTDAVCVEGTCTLVENTATCDDGDPCTEGDACTDGACAGVPMACEDDGNPCTDAVCVDGACASTNIDGSCDDGSVCTLDDVCADGACVGSGELECPTSQCVTATCDPVDGCVTESLDCTDGDTCTYDVCDGVAGCAHPEWIICAPQAAFAFDDFLSPDALMLHLVGDAHSTGPDLQLAGLPGSGGAAWWPQMVAVGDGFDASFSFEVVPGSGDEGEGLAFVVQTLGGDPLGNGPHGVDSKSLSVGIDTASDQLLLSYGSTVVAAAPLGPIEGTGPHDVTVSYAPGSLVVAYDGVVSLDTPVVLQAAEAVDSSSYAWVGFTGRVAATGSQQHLVRSWSFQSRCDAAPCDDGDPCTQESCGAGLCFHGTNVCDDGNPCTADSCDAGTGDCHHEAVACDDGNACTKDVCSPGPGCTSTYEVCEPTIWWPQIGPALGLIATGDASVIQGAARVTSGDIGQRGAVWLPASRDLGHDHHATVTMTLSESAGGGGDGFALVFQDEGPFVDWGPEGLAALGLAVQFDTHQNATDPGPVTLRVLQRGEALVTASLPDTAFADGTYEIDLTLASSELSLRLDGEPLVDRLPVSLDTVVPGGQAWFGVMASTSVARQVHDVTALTLLADCDLPCAGDCNVVHDSPGCGDAVVSACVCATDSTCCAEAWGDSCAALAAGACALSCASCGDGTCDSALGERPTSCPADCGAPALCADTTCEAPASGSCTVSRCDAPSTCDVGEAVGLTCVYALEGTFTRAAAGQACAAAGGALATPADGWQNHRLRAIADATCGDVAAWIQSDFSGSYTGWGDGQPDLGSGGSAVLSPDGTWSDELPSTELSCVVCDSYTEPVPPACTAVPACEDDACATTACDDAVGCAVTAAEADCQGASIRSVEPEAAPLLPGMDAAVVGYLQVDFDVSTQAFGSLETLVQILGAARNEFLNADPSARSFSTQWRVRRIVPLPLGPESVTTRTVASFLVGYDDVPATLEAYEKARAWDVEDNLLSLLTKGPAGAVQALLGIGRLGISMRGAVYLPDEQRWALYDGAPLTDGPSAVLCSAPLSHAALAVREPSPAGWVDHDLVVRDLFWSPSLADLLLIQTGKAFLAVPDRTIPVAIDQNTATLRLDGDQIDVALSGRLAARDGDHLAAIFATLTSPAFAPNLLQTIAADVPPFSNDTRLVHVSAGAETAGGGWVWRPAGDVALDGGALPGATVTACHDGGGVLGAVTAGPRGDFGVSVSPPTPGQTRVFGASSGDDACDPAAGGSYTLQTLPTCAWSFPNFKSLAPGAVDCADSPCTDDQGCDDGKVCTADTCDEGACVHSNVDCDDGDTCTTDTCAAPTGCTSVVSVFCDDGDACTDDTCDPVLACTNTPNQSPCDDGNDCTTGDVCLDGACTGSPGPCDDGDPCTVGDACLPGGCAGAAMPCEDGDACTADGCEAGACTSAPACDDGLGCTTDTCEPVCPMGELIGGSCYLGIYEPMAFGQAAAAAACASQGATLADLGDADEALAARAALTGACQWSVAFVGLDYRGWVTGAPVTWLGGLDAVPEPGLVTGLEPDGSLTVAGSTTKFTCALCEAPVQGATCDNANECADDDVCTTDQCTEQGCAYPAISCDDGDACTADLCDPQSGCFHTGGDCDDSNPCTTDSCDPAVGCSHAFCDDGNACTANVCDPVGGCSFPGGDCDDGTACTVDSCDPAVGCSHEALGCDDGNPCTTDTCDDATGCHHAVLADQTACDLSECTREHCIAGQCLPYANEVPTGPCLGSVYGYNAAEWITHEDAYITGNGDLVLNEKNLFVDIGNAWFAKKYFLGQNFGLFYGLVTDHGQLASGNGVSVNIQKEGTHLKTGSWGVNTGLAVSIIASYGNPRVVVKHNGQDIAERGLPVNPGADSLVGKTITWGVRIQGNTLVVYGPQTNTLSGVTYGDVAEVQGIDLVAMGVLDQDGKAYIGFGADNDGAFIEGGHRLVGFHGEIAHTCVQRSCTYGGNACEKGGVCRRYTSAKSCAELGWPADWYGSNQVCGTQLIDGECLTAMYFGQANAACLSIGARLCTLEELASDETANAGCNFGAERVWTRDGCDSKGGTWTAPTESSYLSLVPPVCTKQTNNAAVACCADVQPDGVFASCEFTSFKNECNDNVRCTADTCDWQQGCLNTPVDICWNLGTGSCCADNGSPGCADGNCQTCVCGLDSTCCTGTWTAACANLATTACWQSCAAACP